jgi:hypothetical protein
MTGRTAVAENLLLGDVEYKVEETALGTWRRFMYANGQVFAEFTSHRRILGLPLIHSTHGRSPETGRRIVAKGVIAVGRLAVGVVAIGHAALGIVAIGQLGLGLVLGLGQAATGVACVAQFGLGLAFGLGQFVTGYVAIGQFALGQYVLAQFGWGAHVWDVYGIAPAAEEFFRSFAPGRR